VLVVGTVVDGCDEGTHVVLVGWLVDGNGWGTVVAGGVVVEVVESDTGALELGAVVPGVVVLVVVGKGGPPGPNGPPGGWGVVVDGAPGTVVDGAPGVLLGVGPQFVPPPPGVVGPGYGRLPRPGVTRLEAAAVAVRAATVPLPAVPLPVPVPVFEDVCPSMRCSTWMTLLSTTEPFTISSVRSVPEVIATALKFAGTAAAAFDDELRATTTPATATAVTSAVAMSTPVRRCELMSTSVLLWVAAEPHGRRDTDQRCHR
jgi:hypothetical protein